MRPLGLLEEPFPQHVDGDHDHHDARTGDLGGQRIALRDTDLVETVIDSTRRLRRTYLAHPAAASLSSFRTTGRPAEMRVVDRTLEAVMAAGYEGLEAAVIYRALGDFALAWCGSEAALLALPKPLQVVDRSVWTQAYRASARRSTRTSGGYATNCRWSPTTTSSRPSWRS